MAYRPKRQKPPESHLKALEKPPPKGQADAHAHPNPP